MPNRVKVKRTYTAGVAPTAAELQPHEFAVNWADGIVFVRRPDGSIQSVSLGGSGSSSLVYAATPAGFPATGSTANLFCATDTQRIYRWDATNSVYVELGPGA